jgi:hypothetical protein
MKKLSTFNFQLSIVCCLLLAASCIKNLEEPQRTIVLSAPEDNATFDLATASGITFDWSMLDDVDKYKIAFSLNEDMIPAATVDATASPHTVPAADIDEALKTLNMPFDEADTVYWSVRASPMLLNIETQVRTLILTRKPLPRVTLAEPAGGVTIDVNSSAFPYTFSWQLHLEIPAYTILFSTDNNFPDGKTVAVNCSGNDRYTLATAGEFDQLLQQAGIEAKQSATVYWTVIATGSESAGEVRSFTGVRLISSLLTPENGSAVKLDYKTPTATALTFEWNNPNNATVELVVGKQANLSDGVTIYTGAGTTKAFTHDELQTLLINSDFGLKKYFANTLYWNVKIGGNVIAPAASYFQLSGQRVLLYGSSNPQVYPVAVIETDGYSAIWMGQDLKTTTWIDGTPLSNSGINIVVAPPSSQFTYSNLATAIAPGDNPKQGYFYQPLWGGLFIIDAWADPKFVPAGWTIPTDADYTALYDAANATGSDDVLKDPEAYNNPSYGAWGLNFYEAGYTDNAQYVYDPIGWHTYVQMDGVITYQYVNSSSYGTGFWRVGTIRFIYRGE